MLEVALNLLNYYKSFGTETKYIIVDGDLRRTGYLVLSTDVHGAKAIYYISKYFSEYVECALLDTYPEYDYGETNLYEYFLEYSKLDIPHENFLKDLQKLVDYDFNETKKFWIPYLESFIEKMDFIECYEVKDEL